MNQMNIGGRATENGNAQNKLELWGGIECTVNRVNDEYFDQLAMSGHDVRLSDLELIARLGIKTVRYPVLWERSAGKDSEHWAWAANRLEGLRSLGINPIVGFVHHGSGPRDTDLLDGEFPEKLAAYARAFAERFPWIEDYTPINEPLTTARFSGLYGHWYPHHQDDASFVRMLVNECRGVQLAMREIRKVNSAARLIQTEDIGKAWSTKALRYQAEFENERRWLSFDLLCGRVNPHHPLWHYLLWLQTPQDSLTPFLDSPCSPDVLGVNYYVTSERFLDERIKRYPANLHGGNHRHRYVDTEAVRVLAQEIGGIGARLSEAWERYHLPLAVTEAHLGCTREEQLRWLAEIWRDAQSARESGIDVRAVTIWSLLGMYDWVSLVTRNDGVYEPGVFDLRAPQPRPTALANMASDLAASGSHHHPALDSPGWWRRSERLIYPPQPAFTMNNVNNFERANYKDGDGSSSSSSDDEAMISNLKVKAPQPILIAGATGTLGRAFARVCSARGLAYRLIGRKEMDIADASQVESALARYQPWAVINAAGYVRVDVAEDDAMRCHRENTLGAQTLALACQQNSIKFVTFSSDLVFNGTKHSPYLESDQPAPLNVYGSSKAEAERLVIQASPSALVIRTSAFFSPWDKYNFVHTVLESIASGESFVAADDAYVSPTYVPDLVHATLDLLIDDERGIWHLANQGVVTWYELGYACARLAGLDAGLVHARPTHKLNLRAARPVYSALGSERGWLLPSLEDALRRYFSEREIVVTPDAPEVVVPLRRAAFPELVVAQN